MGRNVEWTSASILLLHDCIEKKMRASQIACALNTTKNAVIGFCYRRKIALPKMGRRMEYPSKRIPTIDNPPSKPRHYFRISSKTKSKIGESIPLPPETVARMESVPWPPARGQCNFIIGDPKNMKCCGCTTTLGRIYCPAHMAAAYQASS